MSHVITLKDYDFAEFCPVCETFNHVKLDPNDKRYYVHCETCGRLLMLCTVCNGLENGKCNWTLKDGCRMRNQPLNLHDTYMKEDDEQ